MNFRLATNTDEAAIRQLLSEIPLDGTLKVRFQREPSYFNSIDKQGTTNQTIVGIVDGKIKAVASQNLQKIYINGQEKTAAYISNLRFHPDTRHGISLIKGIRFFEEQSALYDIDFHYATMIEKDNKTQKILASNRPRMPKIHNCGKINTYAIPLRKTKTVVKQDYAFKIIKGNDELMPEILNFLILEGKQRNFFPILDESCYDSKLCKADNFFVAFENGQIVGLCSVIYQQNYKQYVLEDFTTTFGLFRVPFNWFLAAKNLHPIPPKNNQIKLATIGFPLVKKQRVDVFNALIDRIYCEFSGTGFHYLTIAFHENDSLNKCLQKLPKIKYSSRLFLVKLKNDKFVPDDLILENSVPFVDLPRY